MSNLVLCSSSRASLHSLPNTCLRSRVEAAVHHRLGLLARGVYRRIFGQGSVEEQPDPKHPSWLGLTVAARLGFFLFLNDTGSISRGVVAGFAPAR